MTLPSCSFLQLDSRFVADYLLSYLQNGYPHLILGSLEENGGPLFWSSQSTLPPFRAHALRT